MVSHAVDVIPRDVVVTGQIKSTLGQRVADHMVRAWLEERHFGQRPEENPAVDIVVPKGRQQHFPVKRRLGINDDRRHPVPGPGVFGLWVHF